VQNGVINLKVGHENAAGVVLLSLDAGQYLSGRISYINLAKCSLQCCLRKQELPK
jgi:hypothetical protein